MVSVIIPVYNGEKYIKRCIESVLNQTYKDIEVIAVDDGSKDSSYEICKKLSNDDSRLKVYTQENSGVSKTRNRGIQLAKGEYIQFIDSDDYMDNTMTECLVNKMEQSNANIVICGCTEIHDTWKRDIVPKIEKKINVSELGTEYPEIFQEVIFNAPWNKLYKRELIKEGFPEDLSLGEDLAFNLAYLKNAEDIYFTTEKHYMYEVHEEGLNSKYRKDSIEISERCYLMKMDFIRDYKIGDGAELDVSNFFIRFVFYGLSDLYCKSGLNNKEKKQILKKWMNNTNVVTACHVAKFKETKYRVSLFLLKNKWAFLFNLMLLMKSRN